MILIYAFDQINLFATLRSVNKKLKHTESRKQELPCLGLESLSQDFDSAVAHNSLSLSLLQTKQIVSWLYSGLKQTNQLVIDTSTHLNIYFNNQYKQLKLENI